MSSVERDQDCPSKKCQALSDSPPATGDLLSEVGGEPWWASSLRYDILDAREWLRERGLEGDAAAARRELPATSCLFESWTAPDNSCPR